MHGMVGIDCAWNHQVHDPQSLWWLLDVEERMRIHWRKCMEMQNILDGLWGGKEVLHQCTESF